MTNKNDKSPEGKSTINDKSYFLMLHYFWLIAVIAMFRCNFLCAAQLTEAQARVGDGAGPLFLFVDGH